MVNWVTGAHAINDELMWRYMSPIFLQHEHCHVATKKIIFLPTLLSGYYKLRFPRQHFYVTNDAAWNATLLNIAMLALREMDNMYHQRGK